MVVSHSMGFPRIGSDREMKKAVEAYWKGQTSQEELLKAGKKIRATNWQTQADAGLDFVSVGDFAWYDHILNWSATLGVVPPRFHLKGIEVDLDTIFRMGRGRAPVGESTSACEMTKWFDTNYHYITPEIHAKQEFVLSHHAILNEIKEALDSGYKVKPIIPGPITYLWLAKSKSDDFNKLSLLGHLIEVYLEILQKIQSLGVEWVQIDEPVLCLDLSSAWKAECVLAYEKLKVKGLKIMVATYFGKLENNLETALDLSVDGLHVDAVRGQNELKTIAAKLFSDKILSVGIVNGRNIWKNDLNASLALLEEIQDIRKGQIWISSSCSLLHCPVDLDSETKLDSEIKSWLAFARQKCVEIAVLAKKLSGESHQQIDQIFKENEQVLQSRKQSSRVHKNNVKERVKQIDDSMFSRKSEYAVRSLLQKEALDLPNFPTTTIGSFPQTADIRKQRRAFKDSKISESDYTDFMKKEIQLVVKKQEDYDLDVLVHGEPERNDMVEYFGELLDGFAFTQNGWVQSYGSRCVKPPIIYGDVERSNPMTIEWSKYAQSLTKRPMKGMLTGALTILCWSFPRDDMERSEICMQIALALRDEVQDLEKAGITVIQIDEPAFREGLPLRQKDWQEYLDWAVKSFRLSASVVQDSTQIHTHMCYSEFNDVIESIAAMDADVITIETSRSDMELLDAFENFSYPNEIGPGVYDIHSPNVPTVQWIVDLMRKAANRVPAQRLWVNPDCGLKTRAWEETDAALLNMVDAAKQLRQEGLA